MGAATGRDTNAWELLLTPADVLRIVIPSVCIMEAWSAFEDERKRRNHFKGNLDQQISQLRRDATSVYASSLLSHLEQARTDNDNLLNDIEQRLRRIVFDLAAPESASPRAEFVASKFDSIYFAEWSMDDPTDYIILAAIKDHAIQNAGEEKVLLTGNSKHFDTSEIQEV
jgi:hypothetical protein